MGVTNTNRIVSFTVTKSNPSGNIVRFAITDSANILTSSKMIRAVLMDALEQYIAAESADLITNGDAAVETNFNKAGDDVTRSIPGLEFDFTNKRANLTLTALTSLSTSGTITATAPFVDA